MLLTPWVVMVWLICLLPVQRQSLDLVESMHPLFQFYYFNKKFHFYGQKHVAI